MQHDHGGGKDSGWRMWLWMAACCIPMVAVAILVALGYWNWR